MQNGSLPYSVNMPMTINAVADIATLLNTSGIGTYSESGGVIKVEYTGSEPVVQINGVMQVLGSC